MSRTSTAIRSISVLATSLLLAAGCDTAQPQMSSERSSPKARSSNGDATKGSLSLKMPAEREGEKLQKLVVILERQSECYMSGYEGDEEVSSASSKEDEADGNYGEKVGPEKKEDAKYGLKNDILADEAEADLEAVDGVSEEDEEVEAGEGYGTCGDSVLETFGFEYVGDKIISIPDLAAGNYYVTLQIYDEQGLVEEGSSWTSVSGGQTNFVQVYMNQVSGSGSLDIQIIRGGDIEPWPLPAPLPIEEAEHVHQHEHGTGSKKQ